MSASAAARLLRLSAVVLALGAASAPAAAQPAADARPLPDPDVFREQVKKRLRSDRRILSQYTYVERREELEVSKLGKVREGPVKVYEVYPSLEPGNTYKRLIEVDGRPLPPGELARNDAEHRRHLEERLEETPKERAERERKDAEDRRREQAAIEDAFRVYDIDMIGRVRIDGHDTIEFRLEPKPDADPRTKEGKAMKRIRARAWISERDYALVRLTFEVIEDITYGWGLVGRLHAGSHGEFRRRKVNDEVWLPSWSRFVGTGRTLLFRTFSVDAKTEYSNYRKFSVKTAEEYETP